MKSETRTADEKERPGDIPAVLPEVLPVQEAQALDPVPAKKTSNVNGADPVLATARDDLARGDLPRALHAYGHLIRHDRHVREILPDLARLVSRSVRMNPMSRRAG